MLSLSMIVVAIWLQAHYFNMFVYENEIYLGVMFDIGLLRNRQIINWQKNSGNLLWGER